MQAAKLLFQLLDFAFGQIFFVLGLDQLLGDIFQIAQNTFQHLAQALHFGADIVQDRSARTAFGPLLRFAANDVMALVARMGLRAVLLETAAALWGAGKAGAGIPPTVAVLIPIRTATIALRHSAAPAPSATAATSAPASVLASLAGLTGLAALGRLALAGTGGGFATGMTLGTERLRLAASAALRRFIAIGFARCFVLGKFLTPLRFTVCGSFRLR